MSASGRRRCDAVVELRLVEADGDLLRRTELGDRVARCREAILAALRPEIRDEVLAQAVVL